MNLRRPADFDSDMVKAIKFVYILKLGANERHPRCRKTIPSGWAIFYIAVGAIMVDILKPSTVVVISTLETSMSMRRQNLVQSQLEGSAS